MKLIDKFLFDVRQLDWKNYWKDFVLGIRRYITKEDESTIPLARTRLKRYSNYLQTALDNYRIFYSSYLSYSFQLEFII
ncbi:acyl-CoA reductase-like protein [Sarcoptes scabiei]|uniref:Acyl-CoA reductase-like protein n=1 Tax=Sarcoptes scabiei TaxID=52283 RepID=A0A132AJV2_SARSC|nr:acyl-CoA reductase-like protein [Sarcoptes scabiei]